MSWIKVTLINTIVFIGILIAAEIGLRIIWTGYKCFSNKCDFTKVSMVEIYYGRFTESNIGLSTYDKILGYKPTVGFSDRINARGWDNNLVTIDSSGFRSNGNNNVKLNDKENILVVGDSMPFGDQVSDTETWPSCLELKTNRKTFNAGVFGYGAAQAVRRASLVTQQKKINTIILSVSVNDDFNRDRLKFRDGFPRPAVIKTSGEGRLSYANVPSIDSVGTKWQPESIIYSIFKFLEPYSMISNRIVNTFQIDIANKLRNEVHPNAASIEEIVKFSIDEFSKLDVVNKLIVLQYTASDFPNLTPDVTQIREQVLLRSKQKNIKAIDTYTSLKKELLNSSKSSVWNGHHTPYGNLIICNEIFNHIIN